MEKPSSSSSAASVLEITIISAEDLRINRRSINKNAFITIETGPNKSQSTGIDSQGGSYPSWNQKLQLPLPYNIKHIRIEAKCKVAAGGVIKSIGSVSIPIADFLEDYTPPNCLHFLSYRLRDAHGERNGIINFSVLIKGALLDCARPAYTKNVQAAGGGGYSNNSCNNANNACRPMPPTSGAYHYQVAGYSYRNTGDMAIGIPVSKGYHMY